MTARAALLAALLAAGACAAPPPPAEAYARGIKALDAGDARTARIELLNAIKGSPADPKIRLAQARVYLALQDGAGAEAELRRALALGAAETDLAHLLAEALLLQGRPGEAAAAAARAGPAHQAAAARLLGRAHHALGDLRNAAAAFNRALGLAPDDAALWIDIGRFRRGTGEVAGAIAAADRAVALDPESAEALTLRGELTRGQYGLAASVPWFDRALEVRPDHLPALVERATTLGDLGRSTDMLRDTRSILSLSPNHPIAWYLQAVLAARGGAYDLARTLYERTGGALDGRPAAMLLAGAIELETGAPTQAARRLARLVELQPDNLKARRLLGTAFHRSGDSVGAVRALQPLAQRADADVYALTLLGEAYAKLGDHAASARYFARAAMPGASAGTLFGGLQDQAALAAARREAGSQPGDARRQVVLIRALLAHGLGREALERARRLQTVNPGAPDAHLLVGDALAILGDHRGAAGAYRQSANLAFTEPAALRLIEALRNAGDRRGAGQVLSLFLEQNPQSVPALMLAANAHLEARQWRAAIALYERLRRRIGNGDAALLNNLAWAYSESGDFERAIPLARRAWQLDPRNPATADTLGWLLVRSGEDKVEGLALLEQAARGAPTDADIRARLARARAA